MNLLYLVISHSGVNDVTITSYVPQSVIDKVADQWRTRGVSAYRVCMC